MAFFFVCGIVVIELINKGELSMLFDLTGHKDRDLKQWIYEWLDNEQ